MHGILRFAARKWVEKKPAPFWGAGFLVESNPWSRVLLRGRFLGGGVGAGRFVDAGGALVFLADFFDEAAGHEILKLLIGAQAKHFFPAAHRVADFEIGENALEQIVETENLFFRKDITKLIGDMVRKAT